jgi:Eukaryotic elongation factor 5A hypusine, DNA-binding OB fold
LRIDPDSDPIHKKIKEGTSEHAPLYFWLVTLHMFHRLADFRLFVPSCCVLQDFDNEMDLIVTVLAAMGTEKIIAAKVSCAANLHNWCCRA